MQLNNLLNAPFYAFILVWGLMYSAFTNPFSALFTVSAVVGLVASEWLGALKKEVRIGLTVLHSAITILPPIVYLSMLYALSNRGAQLLGHVPKYMINDPKYIGPHDAVYQSIFALIEDWIEPLTGCCFVIWPVLLFRLRSETTWQYKLVTTVLLIALWLLFFLEPKGLSAWWED